MPSYTAPGVYIKDLVSPMQTITLASSSVGAMIGVTQSGVINYAKKIGSWAEYIENFANGLETPFTENSYLPYSVYGFFANGGKELYVISVKKNAKKAKATGESNAITFTAQNEGVWGNLVSVDIKKAEDYDTTKEFDVTVSVGTNDSVVLTVTLETFADTILDNLKSKNWIGSIDINSSVTELAEETITLAGGTDGDELADNDYINALNCLDSIDDVTMVAIPGQTTKVIDGGLLTYCTNNGLFPMLDMPRGSTAEDTKAYRKSISAFTGEIAYPWGKMNDPLTNKLKAVPTCGHLMGLYAKTIEARGVHKAPAGTEAVIRGFIEMETQITPAQLSTLNPIGVICIMSRPNTGIVSWGARSLNSQDTTMRYVTDGLLNLAIKRSLYNGTQFAVFEPNDEKLWKRVKSICLSFLEYLRQEGSLRGTAEQAYYVIVDETNNTDYTIAEGQLNIEIGYAPVKPAEFVIIKLAHSIVSQT